MNEVWELLILIAVLSVTAIWFMVVFCYALIIFGGWDE